MVERIQRQRKKGWKAPPNTVSVCRPGRYGNPYRVGDDVPGMPGEKMDATDAVQFFKLFMPDFAREAYRQELRGKNLMCWCALDQPCHADVLIEMANQPSDRMTEDTPR